MSKKRFIQAVIARSLPSTDKRQAALSYAESLWAWLDQQGYGADRTGQPRVSKDWVGEMNERQKRWFNGFWVAFQLKKGRNEAAARWIQLGELSDADYQQIIDAATKESRRQLPPGQARKEAQGWLFEKRYNDYQPTVASKSSLKNNVLVGLNNELLGIKKLYEASKDEALLPQIEKLENAIKEARKIS
jgi:hypothetical protein